MRQQKNTEKKRKRAGRRPAIPPHIVPVAEKLMSEGLGYRATASQLRCDFGLVLDWTRLRDLRKRKGHYSRYD